MIGKIVKVTVDRPLGSYHPKHKDIVVCKEYQNKHIGRRCIGAMINLAKEKEISEIKANIYAFNAQSQRMFETIGFKKIDEECHSPQNM